MENSACEIGPELGWQRWPGVYVVSAASPWWHPVSCSTLLVGTHRDGGASMLAVIRSAASSSLALFLHLNFPLKSNTVRCVPICIFKALRSQAVHSIL